jgi:hypothetical protein
VQLKQWTNINKAYPERNVSMQMREEYEEIPNGSLVNGGTVIATGRKTKTTAKKIRYKTITYIDYLKQ